MSTNKLPAVVVLDIAFAGYGIARSLHDYHIPVIGFYRSRTVPESYTRLCQRKIQYKDQKDLLDQLNILSESIERKPVLILTTDAHVEFYVKHKRELEGKYLINMPESEMVDLLMDKNKFSVFAKEHNILIPNSFQVNKEQDLHQLRSGVKYPVIMKPYKRTEAWEKAGLKKAYIVADYDQLTVLYNQLSGIESFYIIQEYVQGNDDHVEYCLTYFSHNSDCLIAFTGKKIRQWPVGTGSTATTIPVTNKYLKEETIRIFKALHYTGFGSIEYKRDLIDGKYYLMEPTVGRLNQQEYVATLSGYNIPLAGYGDLTGIKMEPIGQQNNNIVYIDELAEMQSACVHLKRRLITFYQWYCSLKGKRYYRFFNRKDPGVFFIGLLMKFLNILFGKLLMLGRRTSISA